MKPFACIAFVAAVAQGADYHIDFERLFPPAAQQKRELEDAMRAVERHRGHVAASPTAAIDDYGRALQKLERLDAYLYLRYATDTRNTDLLHEEEALEPSFERRTSPFLDEIARLPQQRSGRYAFFINKTRRAKTPLTTAQDAIVSQLTPEVTGWPDELYEVLSARKDTPRDLYAFALLGLVRARTDLARLRGFPDAASEVYAAQGLTRADVRRILTAVAGEKQRYIAFQQHRTAPPASSFAPMGFDDARRLLHETLAPLGPAYVEQLDRLLDPANGRIDITPGEHRKRGGFSKGFPGMQSVLYMAGFKGTYNDVRILAHEGTHAVQRAMQAESGVAPVYARAPSFIMEATAIVAELVLPEALYRRESDLALKSFYLDQLLTSKGISIIFRAAAEAELEERVYDGVARGEIHGAADLDGLTVSTFAQFGIDVPPDEWTRISLMFEDPFYDVNYTLASLVAVPLFAESLADPVRFRERFTRIMQNGFAEPTVEWLKDFANVDLRDANVVIRALDSLQPFIARMTAAGTAGSVSWPGLLQDSHPFYVSFSQLRASFPASRRTQRASNGIMHATE